MASQGVLTKNRSRMTTDAAYRRAALTPPGGGVGAIRGPVPAVSTVGNDSTHVIGRASSAGVVGAVILIPDATITGAATNNRRLRLINKAQDGTGTTIVAELAFGNGTNAAAADEKAVPVSATVANLKVAAGDVLAWESTHIGTGIADPGGQVEVTLSPA